MGHHGGVSPCYVISMCSALIVSRNTQYIQEIFSLETSRNCQPVNEVDIDEALQAVIDVDRVYLDLQGEGLDLYRRFIRVAPQAEVIVINPTPSEKRYLAEVEGSVWTPKAERSAKQKDSDLEKRISDLEQWVQMQIHTINRQLTHIVGENTSAQNRAQLYANINSKVKKSKVVYGDLKQKVIFWSMVTSFMTSMTCLGIVFLIRRLLR